MPLELQTGSDSAAAMATSKLYLYAAGDSRFGESTSGTSGAIPPTPDVRVEGTGFSVALGLVLIALYIFIRARGPNKRDGSNISS